MADFEIAYPVFIDNEGGFVLTNNKNDLGKLTFAGISQRFWPKWAGWVHILNNREDLAIPLVKPFYKKEFWDYVKADQIDNQEIAFTIVDFAINGGRKTSGRLAQKVIGVTADGHIGKQSLCALNDLGDGEAETKFFKIAFGMAKVIRYVGIANKNKTQRGNLRGWINRTVNDLKL